MKNKLLLSIAAPVLLFFFYACGPVAISDPSVYPEETIEMAIPEDAMDEAVMETPCDESGEMDMVAPCMQTKAARAPKKIKTPELKNFDAVLDVTKEIDAKQEGYMSVWIGDPEYKPEIDDDFERKSISMPSDIGQYAKITPVAPGFDVKPTEYIMKIHPSGSSVSFTLTPQKGAWGKKKISALIELYENAECTGVSIPKTQVVSVKIKIKLPTLIGDLFDIFWDKLLIFFGTVLGLLSTYFIVKFKKKMKIEEKDDE